MYLHNHLYSYKNLLLNISVRKYFHNKEQFNSIVKYEAKYRYCIVLHQELNTLQNEYITEAVFLFCLSS